MGCQQPTLDDTDPTLNDSAGRGGGIELARPTQRAKRITTPTPPGSRCRSAAVNGVVLKAIKTGLYDDQQIHEAMQRLAEEGRAVTVDALRYELEGFPASRQRTPKPSTTDERVGQGLALADMYAEQERAEQQQRKEIGQ